MKCQLLFLLLYCSFYVSAQNKIVLDPIHKKNGSMMLYDIVKSIEYVPLKTASSAEMIGRVTSFDVSDNYLLIWCNKSKNIFLYKKNGDFVSLIGNYGQGPVDYYHIGGVFIDELKKRVLVRDRNNKNGAVMKVYDFNGKYIETISPKKDASGVFIRMFNDKYVVYTGDFSENNPYHIDIRDRDLNSIQKGVKNIPVEHVSSSGMRVVSGSPINYTYDKNLYIKSKTLNDTVYKVNNNSTFTPSYILNAGKHEVTPEILGDADKYFNNSRDFVFFMSAYENKKHLFLSYYHQTKNVYCYFDKTNNQLLHFASDQGIPNDYDGGIPIWPQYQDENIWYAFYDAYLFEELLENQKKTTPKGSKEAIRNFEKFYKKVDPEDNPVFLIIELKK